MQNTKLQIIISAFILIFLVQTISAETEYVSTEPQVFQQNKSATIEIPAFENDITQCTTCICEISIKYPNGSFMIKDAATTTDNYHITYLLDSDLTTVLGEYTDVISCNNGADYGAATFSHLITTTGNSPSSQRSNITIFAIFIMFGLGIILFFIFAFSKSALPVKWTYFIISLIFFLIGFNILTIRLKDEVVNTSIENFFDSFTAISWYIYWFAAGLLIIMWLFTFINTWIYKKNEEAIRRYGLA